MDGREIKAPSPQGIADLRAGRGMGLVPPAELNRRPGPLRALGLADPLGLSREQRRRTGSGRGHARGGAAARGRAIATEGVLDRLAAAARGSLRAAPPPATTRRRARR